MFISKDIEYQINVWEEDGDVDKDDDSVPSRPIRKLSFSQSVSSEVNQVNGSVFSSSNLHEEERHLKVDEVQTDSDDKSTSSFGFDLTLPDITLSEYLSFSSPPSKDKDDQEQGPLKDQEPKKKDNEQSFWDRLMNPSKKKS